ncbi:uncharacterized protein LOC144821810 [Lissotriton helveticus]
MSTNQGVPWTRGPIEDTYDSEPGKLQSGTSQCTEGKTSRRSAQDKAGRAPRKERSEEASASAGHTTPPPPASPPLSASPPLPASPAATPPAVARPRRHAVATLQEMESSLEDNRGGEISTVPVDGSNAGSQSTSGRAHTGARRRRAREPSPPLQVMQSTEYDDRLQCFKNAESLKNSIENLEAIFCHRNQWPVEEQPERPPRNRSIHPECSDLQKMLEALKISQVTVERMISFCEEAGQLKHPDQSHVAPFGASVDETLCKSEEATGSAADIVTAAEGDLRVESSIFDSDDKNSELPNIDIYRLMARVTDSEWKHLMRILGITDEDIERIQRENPTDLRDQKYKMMHIWLEKERNNKKTSRKSDINHALNILGLIIRVLDKRVTYPTYP